MHEGFSYTCNIHVTCMYSNIYIYIYIYTCLSVCVWLQVYLPQLACGSVVSSKRAVNGICLAIPRGEFFGFVGVNGKPSCMSSSSAIA